MLKYQKKGGWGGGKVIYTHITLAQWKKKNFFLIPVACNMSCNMLCDNNGSHMWSHTAL